MTEIPKKLGKTCLFAAFIVASAWFLNSFVISLAVVDGDSMEPVLHDGERVWIDRLSYRLDDPKRYDIVVFRYRYRDGQYYMKRIVGLPGETVQIIEGRVCVDGAPLNEDYGVELMKKAKRARHPVTLGEDEYFVLGDNRNHSTDSRDSDVANVAIGQITGKVIQWQEN